LLGFADEDLIERLNAEVGTLIVTQDDGTQIDAADLGLFSLRNPRADDVNVIGRRPRSQAACPPEQIENGFGSLVWDSPLETDDLAQKIDLLAVVFGDPHFYAVRGQAGCIRQTASYFRHGLAFDSHPPPVPQVHATIRSQGPPPRETRLTSKGYIEYVRAADEVRCNWLSLFGCWCSFRHQSAIEV
jgi:hypothetical protein